MRLAKLTGTIGILFLSALTPFTFAAEPTYKKALVVGGGISGMVAAYQLHKSGVDVLLLEKGSKLGGRLSSGSLDGISYDLGAQMLPSRSTYLLNLIKELGIEQQVIEVSPGVVLARGGKLYQGDLTSTTSLVSSGYIRLWELLNPKALWNLSKLLSVSGRPIDDLSEWKDLDTETVSQWSHRSGLGKLEDLILDPMLSPIMGRTETTSKSTLFWIYDYISKSSKIFSLRNGLGQLSDALSARIPHRVGVSVESIAEQDGKVKVKTSQEEFQADYIVLATPANVTRRILPKDNCAYDSSLLEDTHYNSTLVLNLRTNRSWVERPPLKGAYSILFPKSESREIHAVALASAFGNRVAQGTGNLFQVYFRDEFSKANPSASLDVLKQLALDSLERYIPGFSDSVTSASLQRWPDAIPISSPGKAQRVSDYREEVSKAGCRVLLVGDYLNFSGTEPASQTGAWAASEVLKRVKHR